MKLSFSTLGCPDWSFEDIIVTAKDMGYDGVEIRGVGNELDGTRIPEFSPTSAPKTRNLLDKKGLTIACLTSACYIHDKNIPEDTVYQAQAYVDTASDMGIRYVRVLADYGPEQSGELDSAFVCSQLKKVAQYAKPKGVDILVETNGYFANSTRLAKLINDAGEDNVGVIWDIHHPYRYFGERPEFTIGTIGDFIRHVHIKDSVIQGGKLKYTMVGYGDLPVKDCVDRLEKIGYDGFYSLEWLKRWDLSLEEPGIAFAAYVSYMNDMI
ncbi:sugar phosphate isomerase/epimerase [Christensenellaceae bacterium OttesenSCG-928-K19]|nr:sugar phosphate isomerase/epimerase [Christensenellaceae bacterium OttesenSCG-928-K19]